MSPSGHDGKAVSRRSSASKQQKRDVSVAGTRSEGSTWSATPPRPHSLRRRRCSWIWAGVAILAVIHHDFWYWNDPRLVFGFLPVGMAYHVLYSIAAALLWAAAIRYAWPDELEEWANQPPSDRAGRRAS